MRKSLGINHDETRHQIIGFDCKEATAASDQFAGEFSGYAAGIHNIDSYGDMILPGAFADGLAEFKDNGVVCYQHDRYDPIGKPLDAYEDESGLFVKARVSKVPSGEKAMTLLRDKVIKKLSIGYRVNRTKSDGTPGYQYVDRAGLVAYLGTTLLPEARKNLILKTYDEMELDAVFLLRSIRLKEFSPVTFAANNNATVTGVKHLESLAGLSFADHSDAVLAAVKEITTRAQSIHELRHSEGRKNTLSADRRSELEALAGQLNQLLKATAPPVDVAPEAQKLFAEFMAFESRMNGVTV